MAYKVIILYRLYMPPYFLGTFTEYPYLSDDIAIIRQYPGFPATSCIYSAGKVTGKSAFSRCSRKMMSTSSFTISG